MFYIYVLILIIIAENILPTIQHKNDYDILHPLDPLTPDEILESVNIIKTKYPRNWWYTGIKLKEPNKSILYSYLMSENYGESIEHYNIPRKSFCFIFDFPNNMAYEVIINLNEKKIESFVQTVPSHMPANVQNNMGDTWTNMVKNDTRVQKKIKDKGYSLDSIKCGMRRVSPEGIFLFFFYAKDFEKDNMYAHPFDFIVVLDSSQNQIISIVNLPSSSQFNVHKKNIGVTIPKRHSNMDPKLPGFQPGHLRRDMKPLHINSPNGPSYTVEGNLISWQKFKFRIGFNYREGLVLHNMIYQDGDNIRPLFYRISISEFSTSYGDPRPPNYKFQVFDEGWYGLGNPPKSLIDGIDCIGPTTYFNVNIHTGNGSYMEIPNGICLTEVDDGILWMNGLEDPPENPPKSTRSRRLTISYTCTIYNYVYTFMWHFYQDATISLEIRATGFIMTVPLEKGATPFGYGTIVFPQINALYHQHIVAIRIDPMIDGQKNTISTIDIIPVSEDTGSSTNPYGNGFTLNETILKTNGQGRTNVSPINGRIWKISNEQHIHPYTKKPVGYKLIPMNTQPLLMKQNSPYRKLEGYASYSMWVTPYKEEQLFAAGFYVDGNGLPEWVNENDSIDIENEDIVLWHTFTLTHIPRVEDFPVMSQEHTGFTLKPLNFFLGNPALDVPCNVM